MTNPNCRVLIFSILRFISTKCCKTQIYLTFKERHKEEQHVRTIETVIEKDTNVLKWWQKALMWIGIIAIVLSVLSILVHIIVGRLS